MQPQQHASKSDDSLSAEEPLGAVALLATLSHYESTDEIPRHELCPSDEETWCWYNRALGKNETPPSHATRKIKINSVVIEYLKPLYEKFSNVELLQRCVRGGTQNTNECLHSLVWSKCKNEQFQ